ncbi:MAG: hypothetical protein JJ892_05650 [Balneola sp.]|nr:hypothetical protein [Balneola sp.]MBO6650552.1 hypothetical protein [Balneola sp.]MBO6711549.1 hypothetical protein [Balneola sp.]MBO6799745.1 hypothetical protein [Balneola sp.]MBO6870814.1 hypothetical protein [Balneola sp.]
MSDTLRSVLIRRRKYEMVEFMTNHTESFDQAMKLALENEENLSWRSAWLVAGIMNKNDQRVKPFIQRIIDALPFRDDGHQRELLKILLKMELDEEFESLLFDISVTLWEQVRKQSSVRYYAFQGMMKVVEKYPELKNEIISLTQPHFVNALSPGVRKGVLKGINELKS